MNTDEEMDGEEDHDAADSDLDGDINDEVANVDNADEDAIPVRG